MRISDWSSDVCSSDLSDRGQRLPDPFSRDARTIVADLNEAVAALGNYDIDAGRSLERDRPVTRTPYRVERILHIFADRVARLDIHARRQGLEDIGTDQKFRFLIRRSEEHTSELQSLMRISYAVFCLKKKKNK